MAKSDGIARPNKVFLQLQHLYGGMLQHQVEALLMSTSVRVLPVVQAVRELACPHQDLPFPCLQLQRPYQFVLIFDLVLAISIRQHSMT